MYEHFIDEGKISQSLSLHTMERISHCIEGCFCSTQWVLISVIII